MLSNTAKSAAELGLISTSEVSRRLGFVVQATWIVNALGVRPAMSLNGGSAIYWRVEQLKEIACALIHHLESFMDAHEPFAAEWAPDPDEYGQLPEVLMLLERDIEGRAVDETSQLVVSAHALVNLVLSRIQAGATKQNDGGMVSLTPPGTKQVLEWARTYVDGETCIGEVPRNRMSPEELAGLAELERLEKLL